MPRVFITCCALFAAALQAPGGCGRSCGGGGGGGGADAGVSTDGGNGGTVSDGGIAAPPLDRTRVSRLADSATFLYVGGDAPQKGVAPDALDPSRVSVVRGVVRSRGGGPVSGARVSVHSKSELGFVASRGDGAFEIAVNGDGTLRLEVVAPGFLPVHRQLDVPRARWRDAGIVVLTPLDAGVTKISSGAVEVQVVHGPRVDDTRGQRRSTLLVLPGTQASGVMADGTALSLPEMHVRATEFTVGEDGPDAMPGALPPTSAYTHATEFSVDEAQARGAVRVQFDRPVISYLENFLGFPVGSPVPIGLYDRVKGAWEPQPNGRVVTVLSVAGGTAQLDLDGSGSPAPASALTAMGIGDAELRQLALLYPAGQQLWRAPLAHFTPGDLNWPFGAPPGAGPSNGGAGQRGGGGGGCNAKGCEIAVESQVVREAIPIAGTPFTLRYASDRAEGYAAARTIDVRLSGQSVPASVKRMVLRANLAGQTISKQFAPGPDQRTTLVWDGRDPFGRMLQGKQRAEVLIGWVWPAVYELSADEIAFGAPSGSPLAGVLAQVEFTAWKRWTGLLGTFDPQAEQIGGWTLDAHHHYDPAERVIYFGDGRRRELNRLPRVIRTIAGASQMDASDLEGQPALKVTLNKVAGVAAAPNGEIFTAQVADHAIYRIDRAGLVHLFAGNDNGSDNDGVAALAARVEPGAIALGPDGSVYYTDRARIRRIGPDGLVTTVAGTGRAGHSGDGGPATLADIAPISLTVAPDGTIVFVSSSFIFANTFVRRVTPNGLISTIAGGPRTVAAIDGVPATTVPINAWGIAVGPDGDVFIAEPSAPLNRLEGGCIRRIGVDGMIYRVAGCSPSPTAAGDGGPAVDALLTDPRFIVADRDGTVYFAEEDGRRVRRVDTEGVISTVAGTGEEGVAGDGGAAARSQLFDPWALALAPDGALLVVDQQNEGARIRSIDSPEVRNPKGEVLVAAEDATEIYVFDGQGRHLRTLDFLTGATRYSFQYSVAGLLTAVSDRSGNQTAIERGADGRASIVIAPSGRRSALGYGDDGWLASVADPTGAQLKMTYAPGGLLTTYTDRSGALSEYSYDGEGLLSRVREQGSLDKTLARTTSGDSAQVSLTAAGGGAVRYSSRASGRARSMVEADGATWTSREDDAGGVSNVGPDGTAFFSEPAPDPRFALQAGLATSQSISTPGGASASVDVRRSLDGATADPLAFNSYIEEVRFGGPQATPHRGVYQRAARRWTWTSPGGRTSSMDFDATGRPSRLQRGNLLPMTLGYDAAGHLIQAARGERSTAFAYDAAGNLTSIAAAGGGSTSFVYGAADRLASVSRNDGSAVAFGWDAQGRLSSLAPPGREPHRFEYGAGERLTRYTPPSGSPLELTWDATGSVGAVSAQGGLSTSFKRDAAGQLSQIGDATSSWTFRHRDAHLLDVAGGGESLSFAYDGPRLVRTTWSGAVSGSVAFKYGSQLSLASEQPAGGTAIAFTRDADGLLISAGALQLSRDGSTGAVVSIQLGSVGETRGRNPYGEEESVTVTANGMQIYARSSTRDRLGRIAALTEIVQGERHVREYSYNSAGRLSAVSVDGQPAATYRTDSNGNRISGPGLSAPPVFDGQDRLLTSGLFTYDWTPTGELSTRSHPALGTTTYSYDAFGNLRSVSLPGGRRVDYVVDGLHRRVGKSIDGHLVEGFLYRNQLQPIAWLDASGNVRAQFVYASGANLPDSMISSGKTYRLIGDNSGSLRLVIDAGSGAVLERIDYDEFGNVLRDTAPGTTPFGFAGGLRDADTGLIRLGVRDYDPMVGRFTAKDPLLFAGGSLNPYLYADGEPVNGGDPSGQFLLVGAAVGAGIDLGIQLLMNGGRLDCVNWWQVGASALAGAAFGILAEAGAGAIGDFFWNEESFKDISSAYWEARGGADGMSLDHWLFSQAAGRAGDVPMGAVNAGFNLVEMPMTWNRWLGFAPNWGGAQAAMASVARVGVQAGIPTLAASSAYAGYRVGQKAQQPLPCGCK